MKPTKKGCIAMTLIITLFLLVGWLEMAYPYAGQKCNFGGDCDFNETCVSIPYHQRDGSSYRGICVPKSW